MYFDTKSNPDCVLVLGRAGTITGKVIDKATGKVLGPGQAFCQSVGSWR